MSDRGRSCGPRCPRKANLQARHREECEGRCIARRSALPTSRTVPLPGEGIGGLQECHKNAGLQGSGGTSGFGARTHAPNIVVITTIVKRESLRPAGWALHDFFGAAGGQSGSGSFAGLA